MAPTATPIDYRIWKLMAWSGLTFMALLIVGWGILGGNIPPLGEDVAPDGVKAWFVENGTSISIGTSVSLTISSLYMVWGCGISQLMRRVEGRNGLLSNLEQMGATITVAPITVAMGLFLICSLEAPILDAPTVHLMYHLGWMIFDLAYMVTSFQIAAISIVFLRDKREKPLVPSFVCWWGWVTFASFFAVSLIPFVETGPFAWHGAISFWFAFFTWFIWCPLLSYYVITGVARVQAEDEAAGVVSDDDLAALEISRSPLAGGAGGAVQNGHASGNGQANGADHGAVRPPEAVR